MKIKLYLVLYLIFLPFVIHAQDMLCEGELHMEDNIIQTRSSRVGSAEDFYNDLNNWIPRLTPNEPLKNPPITNIEISFHVFLDDNGGNLQYPNNATGRSRLLEALSYVNQIYSGYPDGPSDPVSGVVELPNYDTRIRFTLGENNERIYFYNNSTLNKQSNGSMYENYIRTNYPARSNKLNVYFTASHYGGRVKQENIVITNGGSGYTSIPTVSFNPSGAKGNAIVENGIVTAIAITSEGSYNYFDPPIITISGGGGSGASAYITTLSGGTGGYTYPPSASLSYNTFIVMGACTGRSEWIAGMMLAHELGHDLDLVHTYCGGGAFAVCSSGNCTSTWQPNYVEEYLVDIFGVNPGTCPHIAQWANPFDNTLPDAEKITNNVVGGSASQTYISPKQAGQIHRTLALKSTRKYVKKETYSPIPLVISSSEVWDFNLKLYRDITISSGAVLTLANVFELPYNGTITVNAGGALVIEGSIKLSDNNKIIIQNGGTLKFTSGSSIEISGNGYIDIQSGSYFCITSGSTIKLNDVKSVIKLRPNYINGVNPAVVPASSCVSSIVTYPTIGNGAIKDYTTDIYIQNETITTDSYYMGNNIYVGSNVTSSKPQGNVTITNNANVIFDAGENVYFEAGFECTLGASYEVRQ